MKSDAIALLSGLAAVCLALFIIGSLMGPFIGGFLSFFAIIPVYIFTWLFVKKKLDKS